MSIVTIVVVAIMAVGCSVIVGVVIAFLFNRYRRRVKARQQNSQNPQLHGEVYAFPSLSPHCDALQGPPTYEEATRGSSSNSSSSSICLQDVTSIVNPNYQHDETPIEKKQETMTTDAVTSAADTSSG